MDKFLDQWMDENDTSGRVNRILTQFLPNEGIAKNYMEAGLNFAHPAQRYEKCYGETMEDATLLDEWCFWENAYVARKFKPLTLTDFLSSDIYGKSLEGLLNVKLKKGEIPKLPASEYREMLYPTNSIFNPHSYARSKD